MGLEIQRQLSLQVDLSFQRHHDFMVEHGLERCRNLVDIGTGSGRFLAGIAREHPTIECYGIDDKAHMLQAAMDFDLPNLGWSRAHALDRQTAELLRWADGVLMRNIVLHLPNTSDSLREILGATRPGTRLWVFDVDLDHCQCVPDSAAFRGFTSLVHAFCKRSGVELRTAARLPRILAANGFEVAGVVVEPFNNQAIEGPRFAEYLMREASLYHFSVHGTPGTAELQPLSELLLGNTGGASQFVQYGMVMLAAEKRSPNAQPPRPPAQAIPPRPVP
jgi:SAM-dependent methyltransferase